MVYNYRSKKTKQAGLRSQRLSNSVLQLNAHVASIYLFKIQNAYVIRKKKKERTKRIYARFSLSQWPVLTRFLAPLPSTMRFCFDGAPSSGCFSPISRQVWEKTNGCFTEEPKVFYGLLLPPTNFPLPPALISIIFLEIIRLEGNLGYFVWKPDLTFRKVITK